MESMKTVFEVALCWADEYIEINEFDLRRNDDEAERIF